MRKNNANATENITKVVDNTKKIEIDQANVSELRGLLAESKRNNLEVAIIKIPARLLAIDESYQTPLRTERDLGYLINNWDERKLLPLIVVPHEEVGLCYITDGQGRWKASQFINEIRYEYLTCLVILNAPKDPTERRKFEAEQYVYQNKNVAKITPLQKHGGLRILGDPAVRGLDKMKDKYRFTYTYTKGQRDHGVLGSYTEALSICKTRGIDCLDYIFDICTKSGFDRKCNGYSSYVLRMLRDMWTLYANNRYNTKEFLSSYLRNYEPNTFKAKAVSKYPMLDNKAACSLYVEDLIVENLGLKQSREISGTRLIPINVKSAS